MEHYAVDNIEQMPTQHWMCKCPDLDEVSKVISMLCDGKSPSADGQHPEVIKRGGRKLVEVIYITIKDASENIEVTADWKDTQLVTTFKKRDRRDRDNYWEISLLSIPGKVFAWLSTLAEDFLSEAQCGFHTKLTWSPGDKYKRDA